MPQKIALICPVPSDFFLDFRVQSSSHGAGAGGGFQQFSAIYCDGAGDGDVQLNAVNAARSFAACGSYDDAFSGDIMASGGVSYHAQGA